MPELKISDGQGNLDPLADLTVQAVMQFPADSPEGDKARMNLLRLGSFKQATEESEETDRSPISVDPRDMRNLLELIQSGVDDQDSKRFAKGLIAGRVLLLIGIAARDLPKAASVNRAIGFLQKLQKNPDSRRKSNHLAWLELPTGTFRGPTRKFSSWAKKTKPKQSRHPLTNTSERSLRASWNEFKPVAHLFAAYELSRSLIHSIEFRSP